MPQTTLREALQQTAQRLALKPELADNARLDARQLLEIATGLNRVQMLAAPEMALTEPQASKLEELIGERLRAVPIQYIRGSQEFYGRDFLVTPDVLIPRPETELIVDEVLRLIPHGGAERHAPLRLLDVGTGSGILAITLALELPTAQVTALDISPAALVVAQRNAQSLNVDPARLRFLKSDLLAAVAHEPPFDVVVSNPPYVPLADAPTLHPQVRDHEPHLALFGGPDGHDVLRRLIPEAWLALRPDGWLLLETAGRDACLDQLLEPWCNVYYRHDLQQIERIAVAQTPRT